jgi:hypothetical protein
MQSAFVRTRYTKGSDHQVGAVRNRIKGYIVFDLRKSTLSAFAGSCSSPLAIGHATSLFDPPGKHLTFSKRSFCQATLMAHG